MAAGSLKFEARSLFVMSEKAWQQFLARTAGTASEVIIKKEAVVVIMPNSYSPQERVKELNAIAGIQRAIHKS